MKEGKWILWSNVVGEENLVERWMVMIDLIICKDIFFLSLEVSERERGICRLGYLVWGVFFIFDDVLFYYWLFFEKIL